MTLVDHSIVCSALNKDSILGLLMHETSFIFLNYPVKFIIYSGISREKLHLSKYVQ